MFKASLVAGADGLVLWRANDAGGLHLAARGRRAGGHGLLRGAVHCGSVHFLLGHLIATIVYLAELIGIHLLHLDALTLLVGVASGSAGTILDR